MDVATEIDDQSPPIAALRYQWVLVAMGGFGLWAQGWWQAEKLGVKGWTGFRGVLISAYTFNAESRESPQRKIARSFRPEASALFFTSASPGRTALCALAPNFHVLLHKTHRDRGVRQRVGIPSCWPSPPRPVFPLLSAEGR
jgi:hypothetical protein